MVMTSCSPEAALFHFFLASSKVGTFFE
jgi:hypothetical protein